MERISEKQLKSLVDYLNKLTNSPTESYTKGEDSRYHANIGCYVIDSAYSGWQLQRISNEGGGVSQPIGGGYDTKREAYEKISAFIRGIEAGKSAN